MRPRVAVSIAGLAAALVCATLLRPQNLPFEPPHNSGQSITGAFEGWFPNPDGSFHILLGYFNRNLKQEIDIPIGPNNRIEPGGPDQGQPTHFLPGRQWGVFTIKVPKDFGEKKLTWTITVNGKTTVIPVSLNTLWEVEPFREATGNTPPFIGFSESGPFVQGPAGATQSISANMGGRAGLTVWLADDAMSPIVGMRGRGMPVTVRWSKFRGPGDVTFTNDRPTVERADFKAPPPATFTGKASTEASFSAPGEYTLHMVANDWSGDGGRGFQCCWSNAHVRVTVK